MGCPPSSSIPRAFCSDLRRLKPEVIQSFCAVFTRVYRVSVLVEITVRVQIGVNLRGWLALHVLETYIPALKSLTSALTTTIPFGLRDRALRVAPQVRLKILRVLSIPHQLRYKGNASPMRLQRPERAEPCFRSLAAIEAQSTPVPPHSPGQHPAWGRIVDAIIRDAAYSVVRVGQNRAGNLVIPSYLHTHCTEKECSQCP